MAADLPNRSASARRPHNSLEHHDSAQITLAYSQDAGIVAIAGGEQYRWAHTALEESGFLRGNAGVYRLPTKDGDTSRAAVADLLLSAERHRTNVTVSSRRFIGDVARDIARLLPGRWDTTVEIYAHPVWQGDLVPWLWDSGELSRAVQTSRVPYAATLTDSESGTALLLVERPSHQLDYLVGAFAPMPLNDGYGDEHAPRDIVLPSSPGRAAQAISDRLLPAYERAVNARRAATVASALSRIRAKLDTWKAALATTGYGDANPIAIDQVGETTAEFLEDAWLEFLTVLDLAPGLLDQCRPADSPWPEDAEALGHLADALTEAESIHEDLSDASPLSRRSMNARMWPSVESWLAHGTVFLRQARAAGTPSGPAVPLTPAPLKALPPAPAPRR
ncbi:hypothetical protein ACFQ69_02490 [Streptomyces sp. NPDC056470]|uniref:hypothetical protein n=1 Tax=Streptomyces sp. NPDC056470 TaxID=3345831 RepID=UPI0036D0FF3A